MNDYTDSSPNSSPSEPRLYCQFKDKLYARMMLRERIKCAIMLAIMMAFTGFCGYGFASSIMYDDPARPLQWLVYAAWLGGTLAFATFTWLAGVTLNGFYFIATGEEGAC